MRRGKAMEKIVERDICVLGPPGAAICVSHFNRSDGAMARTFNSWNEGICFHSASAFRAGAVVRVRSCRPEGGCAGRAVGPPINALGVVTRCRRLSDADPAMYEVSVRYFLPEW